MGDFFASVRRQTMHDHSILLGHRHRPAIDLVRAERIQARLRFLLLAHAGPHVSVNSVGIRYCFFDGMSYCDIRAGPYGSFQNRFIRLVTLRAGQREREWHDHRCLQPRMNHVVTVADERDLQAIEIPLVFNQRLTVRQYLARMKVIRERIDHRHR